MCKKEKTKVIHMVTVAASIDLMRGQLKHLVDAGFDVTVVTSSGENIKEVMKREHIDVKIINMERSISPIKDLISLIKLIIYFMKVKPDICNAGTPKAGLLGMIAAKITRVPFKIYTNRGVLFEIETGIKKKILLITEKIASYCADKVICISPSIQETLIRNNITNKNKTIVFGSGSSNGLILDRFVYNDVMEKNIRIIVSKYKLKKFDFIIGTVGRINKSKGIKETVLAFEQLQKKHKQIGLILVGGIEEKDSISEEIKSKIKVNPNIIHVGRVANPIPYYYIMDVLSFPTYREGFGNVSIEAQATGTPVVTTNATGAKDTVIDNETGFIINVSDINSLVEKIEQFIANPQMKSQMGESAKRRALNEFDSKKIWKSLESLYLNYKQ